MIQFFFISKSTNSCVCCLCGTKQEKEKREKKRHSIKSDARLICYIIILYVYQSLKTAHKYMFIHYSIGFWNVLKHCNVDNHSIVFYFEGKKNENGMCMALEYLANATTNMRQFEQSPKLKNLSKVTCSNIYRIITTTPTGSQQAQTKNSIK